MEDLTVGERMTREVISLPETATLGEAMDLLRSRHFRHIPIVRGGRLVGIVSDRDLLRALPSAVSGAGADEYRAALETITLGRIMTRDPETTTPGSPLADVVERMRKRNIGAFPVVDGPRLCGIITDADCQNVLLELLRGPRAVVEGRPSAGASRN